MAFLEGSAIRMVKNQANQIDIHVENFFCKTQSMLERIKKKLLIDPGAAHSLHTLELFTKSNSSQVLAL